MPFYRLESLNFLIRQLANPPIRQLSSYYFFRFNPKLYDNNLTKYSKYKTLIIKLLNHS